VTTVVIGAGLSGLVRADLLARSNQEVRLLEETDRPGGVVRSERRDGFLLELGPNTVRPTPELWDMVCGLGLENETLLADPRAPRYVDFRGRLHAVPMSPWSFLSTGLLSLGGKLRILREPFVPPSYERQESVRDFFARRLGTEVAERLIEPFVSGIFAGDASRLSIAGCFPTLARWEREHGSLLQGAIADLRGPRKPRAPVRGLLSFRGGLETLPRALASRLGSILETGTRVEKILRSGDVWTVRTSRGDISASSIVIATPAHRAARLIEDVSPSAAFVLDRIPHPPLAVLHLAWPAQALPSPLLGFGHLVAPQRERRILGAVYSSSLFPDRTPQGQTLVTVFLGGSRDPEAASLPDAELSAIAARDLRAVLGARVAPRLVGVTRYERALPQYDLSHESRMDLLEEAELGWPGLTLLGNYRGGVSVGDVVRNALAL
jgi:oxygen-dependent protoporphyrinogen oxidase